MGIAGGAVFSGLGVYFGMRMHQKRQKEKENEKEVELGEGVESNKEIGGSE